MAEVIWTEPALNDLNEIADYIALTNLAAAKSLIKKIFDRVSRLQNHPESGKKPKELLNLNYREVVVNPCRIFYKVEKQQVFVLHVMRQERDLINFLLKR